MLSSVSDVPQTMVCAWVVPHTMLSSSVAPHTTMSPFGAVLQLELLQLFSRHTLPQTIGSPFSVRADPHMTSAAHAFASGRSTPPPMRWLPQLMCLFQGVGSLSGALAGAGFAPLAKAFASWTAPRAFRNPAPCVRSLKRDLCSAVYCRIAFTRFGESAGFAWIISATVPATTGADMLVPLRLKYGCVEVSTVPQRRAAGCDRKSELVASVSDSMPTPGATMSGLAAESM